MEGPMLRALLEDRFHLKIRHVTRESPMYSLHVAAKGANLQPAPEGSCEVNPLPPPSRGNCGDFSAGPFSAKRRGVPGELQYVSLEGRAIRLDDFCRLLAAPLGRPVIDKTGISGRFDFHLKFASEETPALLRPLYPSLFSVVEEQLGLKLEPFTGPREFFVIDQVQKPLPG